MQTMNRAQRRCAAQHFGPWMIEPQWFAQAVQAVKSGGFEKPSDTQLEAKPEDDAVVYEVTSDGTIYTLYERRQGLAVVPMFGQMTKGDSSFGGINSIRARKAIRMAANDDKVRGLLLHIDSPGGTVAGTADLADDVRAAGESKPVAAYIEDLGASAAYWVASQAGTIFANPTALIGSIGTYAVIEDTSGAMDRAGIKVHVISTGAFKGMLADGAPVKDEHLAEVRREIELLNEHFLTGVANGRRNKIGMDEVRALADGRVHIADEAKQLGLIDEVASLDAAMTAFAQRIVSMNEDNFRQFAAEHPDSPAVKDLVARGHKSGAAEARTDEVNRLKAIRAACPGRPEFAMDQFVAGAEPAHVVALVGAIETETKALAEKNAALAAQLEAAKALAAGNPGVAAAPATEPTDKPDGTNPQALAEWEWETLKPKGFTTKDRYVAARVAVLTGRLTIKAK
jgi:signal peptide peptidase SppA